MLTIFTAPKPFKNNINTIQRNAISSWKKLNPQPEIILFGDDEGVREAAREFNVLHVPTIKKNELGTPLVSDIFEQAQKLAKTNILAYVNADIVLTSDFLRTAELTNSPKYLVVGRRWDLDVKEEIDFNNDRWEEILRANVEREAKLHGPAGIDYFIFPKGLWQKIPSFAIGRTCWDNWLLYQAWISGAKLIDATERIKIVHQNHHYSNPKGKLGVWMGEEARKNLKLAGGVGHMLTIRDANLVWAKEGLKKPKMTFYRFLSFSFRYFDKISLLRPIFFPGWLGMIIWRKIQRQLT